MERLEGGRAEARRDLLLVESRRAKPSTPGHAPSPDPAAAAAAYHGIQGHHGQGVRSASYSSAGRRPGVSGAEIFIDPSAAAAGGAEL